MARKITAGNKDVAATLSGSGYDFTEKLLKQAAPETFKLIELEFSKILESARADWPVRAKRSKNSRGKLGMGVRLSADGSVIAYIDNTAEYAWAIRAGKDSETSVPFGKRVSDELLWKPSKKIADKIAKSLADELFK